MKKCYPVFEVFHVNPSPHKICQYCGIGDEIREENFDLMVSCLISAPHIGACFKHSLVTLDTKIFIFEALFCCILSILQTII